MPLNAPKIMQKINVGIPKMWYKLIFVLICFTFILILFIYFPMYFIKLLIFKLTCYPDLFPHMYLFLIYFFVNFCFLMQMRGFDSKCVRGSTFRLLDDRHHRCTDWLSRSPHWWRKVKYVFFYILLKLYYVVNLINVGTSRKQDDASQGVYPNE